MKQKPLNGMNKSELKDIFDALELDYEKGMTNAEMVKAIENSGKYKATKESHAPMRIDSKTGRRVHPQLGEYKKVRVQARDPKDTNLFFSIGLYTVEFRAGDTVELPKAMIKFIKSCYTLEPYFDKNGISENGNIGVHTTREVPLYFVEDAEDED
jgi:hypothetical protein